MNCISFTVCFPTAPTEQEKEGLLDAARAVFATDDVLLNTTATRLTVTPAPDADVEALSSELAARAQAFSCVVSRVTEEGTTSLPDEPATAADTHDGADEKTAKNPPDTHNDSDASDAPGADHTTPTMNPSEPTANGTTSTGNRSGATNNHTASAGTHTASMGNREHRVPLSVFVASVCSVLILAILATYTLTAGFFSRKLLEERENQWNTLVDGEMAFPELELFQELFEQYSIYDLNHDELVTAVLKAYAAATGDTYAAYYTEEELEALFADDRGEMEGIGVSVVNTTATYNGAEYATMTVISVFADSPALAAGLRVGDQIFSVITVDGSEATVEQLGYDGALSCVRGVAGTKAEFSVLRTTAGGRQEIVKFSVERAKVTTESVTGRVHADDPSIGIVKISQFDLTTPTQFSSTMDSLIARGCKKFIFDVRYNPGGDLASIEAVLSTLLWENDVMLTIQYNSGDPDYERVQVVRYSDPDYAGCSVTKKDIGKYRGYEFAVIANEYTASAAEVFTSNLRDYQLATVVGVKTFGKGCMQSIMSLKQSGILDGAIKLTTALYLPPCGVSYHGIGIEPDEGYAVEMDAAVIEKYGNIYLIPDSEDPQLAAAVRALQK